jgi:hypothetical protein
MKLAPIVASPNVAITAPIFAAGGLLERRDARKEGPVRIAQA